MEGCVDRTRGGTAGGGHTWLKISKKKKKKSMSGVNAKSLPAGAA